jgi:hypothetical protein
LSFYGRFGYVGMTRFLIKKIFSYTGHLPLYGFAPFMIIASACGGSRPLYEDVYTVNGGLLHNHMLPPMSSLSSTMRGPLVLAFFVVLVSL